MSKNNKNKQAKLKISMVALALLITFFGSALVGCVSMSYDTSIFQNALYTHLVFKEGVKTVENFKLNYSQAVWADEDEKQGFVTEIEGFFNVFAADYNNGLQKRFGHEPFAPLNFTTVVNENDNIILVANFPNTTIWGEVTKKAIEEDKGEIDKEGQEEQAVQSGEVTKNFFTKTRIDRTERIGSIVEASGVKTYFATYFEQKVLELLLTKYPNVLSGAQIKSAYVYAAEHKRLHSNADVVAFAQGKYFHQWDLTLKNEDVVFYTISARVEIWYTTAIAAGFLTLGIVFLVGFISDNKKKKNQKDKNKNALKLLKDD